MITMEEVERQKKNEETTKLNLITPILKEKWDNETNNIVMEFFFTDGRIVVDDYNTTTRGEKKKADYIMFYRDNIALAIVEAKGSDESADDGFAQAKEYASILDVPFAYSTNGDDLIEIDMILGTNEKKKIKDFPKKEDLWNRFVKEKNFSPEAVETYTYPYYKTPTSKTPRYYQKNAINRTVEKIINGEKRILIVMATGTGKTFTSFQIIYRFWKTKAMKKILFLADRNVLVDQTMKKDFKPFMDAMIKIDHKNLDTSKNIYLSLYQQLTSSSEKYYEQLPRDFFDLIVVDEAHRGSANEDSSWRGILDYFSSAVQIGLTATPKDGGIESAQNELIEAENSLKLAYESNNSKAIEKAKKDVQKAKEVLIKVQRESNVGYFGNPIYTYSLKQGIEDGFLAPYKVTSVELDIDRDGYMPKKGTKGVNGEEVELRRYQQSEFDRKIIVEERRELVAERITSFLKVNDMRTSKTIVFCESIEHAQETTRLLENLNSDLVREDPRYIMTITGDNEIGKKQLENFIDPNSKYPVIAVTSRLLSTGVDVETCKNIVLDRSIGSMTEFKQILGRGTRVKENFICAGEEDSKMFFNVLDFRKNYLKFSEPDFDGEPVSVAIVEGNNDFTPPPAKPPVTHKPQPPKGDIIRVNNVDIEVVGEEVRYLDENGNLVKQSLTSCIKNNILDNYATPADFKNAWFSTKNKEEFGLNLLCGRDYSKIYSEKLGYNVDLFDVILQMGYDIGITKSKLQRSQNASIARYISETVEDKRGILRILLKGYVENGFNSLKDIKVTFSNKQFSENGVTPLGVIKKYFGTKENYFKVLQELENKVYE